MHDPRRELEGAIEELRRPVAVRPAWRDALLRDIGDTPIGHAAPGQREVPGPRWWLVRPSVAIAASVALLCGGIWIGSAITAGRDARIISAEAIPVERGQAAPLVTVRFLIVARGAGRVSLVGDFNGWNPSATPLRRASDGSSWIAEVPLAPGPHVYAFVVDGNVVTDPAAPVAAGESDFGVRNSVVFVGGGG
jgi:hypothetical protein